MAVQDDDMEGLSLATDSSTQPTTQPSQQASQPDGRADTTLWGILTPCNSTKDPINLHKLQPEFRIGRDPAQNDLTLKHPNISKRQCTLKWDQDETSGSSVIVKDHSKFGTYINGKRIPEDEWMLLHDGNELAFNTHKKQKNEENDFRYIYHHMAYSPPTGAVHHVYDLQYELGKGGFGTVMKALHKREGRWYAIKVIQTHKLQKQWAGMAIDNGVPLNEQTKYFIREINILKKLQNPYICQFKEVFIERSNIWIVHRDLKPENILLTKDYPPVVKVGDFGFAKVVDTLSVLKSQVGTQRYVAPEVLLLGPDGYGQTVDSWSVGIITLLMITMAFEIFVNDDVEQPLWVRVRDRRVDLNLLYGRVSQRGVDFVRDLVRYEPNERMTLIEACSHRWLVDREEPSFFESVMASDAPYQCDAYSPITIPTLHPHAIGGDRAYSSRFV
ncbi:hypothetical protein BN946_scf184894.g10 [Trametes cinnabarina]|uniref:Protein kinase domain-containing protein n=1 Tax=Pycnoporus cinnabarinus TaxID=5643 RepID=A0A060SPX9_PYCCI|nr:hypothetical protein BN946_scf184894.g10 [Trametes cinnabarina]